MSVLRHTALGITSFVTALLVSCSAPTQTGGGNPGTGANKDKDFANRGFESSGDSTAGKDSGNKGGSIFSRPSDGSGEKDPAQKPTDQDSSVNKRSVIETPVATNIGTASNPPPSTPTPSGGPGPTPANPSPSGPTPSGPTTNPPTPPVIVANPSPTTGGGGGTQCRVQTNRLVPKTLGLADDTFGQPYLPFTLLVEVEKSGTSSRCVAIVDSLTTEVFVGKFRREITFPRIIFATHCLESSQGKPITKMTFTEPTTGTKAETTVDANGTINDVNGKPLWSLNSGEIKSRGDDPCTEETKKQKVQTPCFTMHQDRYTLISYVEEQMIAASLAEADKKGQKISNDDRQSLLELDNGLLTLRLGPEFNYREAVIDALPPNANGKLDWSALFLRASLRGAKTWDIYRIPPNLFGVSGIDKLTPEKMTEVFYKFLDQNLVTLRFTTVLRGKYLGPPLQLTKKLSWKELVTPYIRKNANGYFGLVSAGLTQAAMDQIKTIDSQFQFKHGDSGTVMLAEVRLTTDPLITLRREFALVGVLSTVAGEPVCEGDDLSCCETK